MKKYDKLLQYALRIIAKKRYTTFEMTQKLQKFVQRAEKWREETEERLINRDESMAGHEDYVLAIQKVLARLQELKYLNDSQYASDYVSDRIKLRPRGKFLLSRELKMKGIDSELIEKAVNTEEVDETEMACRALEKKSRQWDKLPSQKKRERAFRFLSSRGFRPDTIYKAVNNCYDNIVK